MLGPGLLDHRKAQIPLHLLPKKAITEVNLKLKEKNQVLVPYFPVFYNAVTCNDLKEDTQKPTNTKEIHSYDLNGC